MSTPASPPPAASSGPQRAPASRRKDVWVYTRTHKRPIAALVAAVLVGIFIGLIIFNACAPNPADMAAQAIAAQASAAESARATATVTTGATTTATAGSLSSGGTSTYGSTSEPGKTGTAGATVPPAGTGAGKDCTNGNSGSMNVVLPVSKPANETDFLYAMRGSAVNVVRYAGEYVEVQVLKDWMAAARCNGFYTEVQMDNVFAHFTHNGVFDEAGFRGYMSSFNDVTDQLNWVVSMNAPGVPVADGEAHAGIPGAQAISGRCALMGDISNRSTVAMIDYFNTEIKQQGTDMAKAYHCSVHEVVWLPLGAAETVNTAGAPADQYNYHAVGVATVAIGDAEPRAAVQAFDQGAGLPTPEMVGQWSIDLTSAGVRQIDIYTEEEAADDPNLMRSYAAEVAKAFGK